MKRSWLPRLCCAMFLVIGSTPSVTMAAATESTTATTRPDLVLITIDTIRADALAPWGGRAGLAPTIERLATNGTVADRAISSAPLTLPAHASLLTGLELPAHGLRDNGVGALPAGIKTLAQQLATAGWDTAAAVGSRVLDRRFGLDRGFARYDDGAPAEYTGQYGYPERDAIATTTAALALAQQRPKDRPLFLWVHYYDPHAPYLPADGSATADPRASWEREIAVVDREVGRLLADLGARPQLVAVVGDHGEAFGEHGEEGHGLLLHEAVLRVPLVLAGPGVPSRLRVGGTIGTVRLANTLLATLGLPSLPDAAPAIPLDSKPRADSPILSETWLPWTAWGWSPLQAISEGPWRLIVGPKPRLYELAADPAETTNRIDSDRRVARRLEAARSTLDPAERRRDPQPADDAQTAATLRSLGYIGAGSGRAPASDLLALVRSGLPDPWLGPPRLAEHERAKRLLGERAIAPAMQILDRLVTESPKSVPFLTTRAAAREESGDPLGAMADLDRAIEHAPTFDFLALARAGLLERGGKIAEAEAEWTRALTLNPRLTAAWLSLAEIAATAGKAQKERQLLESGVAAGCESAGLHARLAQLDLAREAFAQALEHAQESTRLTPGWSLGWQLRARAEQALGQEAAAAESRRRAMRLGGR